MSDDDETIARKIEARMKPRASPHVARRIVAITQQYQNLAREERIAEEKERAARAAERHGEDAHEVAEEEEEQEVVLARTTNRRHDQDS